MGNRFALPLVIKPSFPLVIKPCYLLYLPHIKALDTSISNIKSGWLYLTIHASGVHKNNNWSTINTWSNEDRMPRSYSH